MKQSIKSTKGRTGSSRKKTGGPAGDQVQSGIEGDSSFKRRRQKIKELLKDPSRLAELSGQECKQFVHELGTCLIELEKQNEELRRGRGELEKSRGGFADRYDFVPAGFFDLDPQGKRKASFLRAIIDATDVMLVYLDPDFNFLWVNPAYARACGMTPKDLAGKNHFVLFPHKENEEIFRRVRDGGEPVFYKDKSFELPDQPERGVTYWDWSLVPVKDSAGRVTALVFSLRETTKYKQAELELAESEERFRRIVKESARLLKESEERLNRAQRIAQLGSWELDIARNVLTWSDEVFRIFGLEPQSFAPCYEDFLSLIHPEDRERVHNIYMNSLREGNGGYEIEHRIVRKSSGKIRYVHEKCEHFRDETGKVVRSGGMVHDITERNEAEKKILILNNELQRNIRQLAVSNKELERSNQDLQQYAYIISHDLQEPLRTVSSFVQLLRRRYQGKLDAKADTYINFAVEGAAHMQILLTDLLQFSRVGGGELRLEKVSLEAALKKNVLHLLDAIEESGAQIEFESLPVVPADEMQLNTLLQNLISNALKFRGEQPPRINVSSKREGNEWIIRVRDNGIGLDPQFSEQIFLIFQRLHRRAEYSGTGIGLAICKKVVERHGGRIWVESAPGQGAAFYFSLPAGEGRGI